jgi:hypothetical protein
MARRTRLSSADVLRPVMRTVLCAAGLVGGLAVGGFIIYVTGLWNELGRVVDKPPQGLTKVDLIMAGAPFVVVLGCGWLGARWGMNLAAKLET